MVCLDITSVCLWVNCLTILNLTVPIPIPQIVETLSVTCSPKLSPYPILGFGNENMDVKAQV